MSRMETQVDSRLLGAFDNKDSKEDHSHLDFMNTVVANATSSDELPKKNVDVPTHLENHHEMITHTCQSGPRITVEDTVARCQESKNPAPITTRPALDCNADYYIEIYNYVLNKSFPESATMNYKMLLKKRAKNYSVKEGVLYYGMRRVVTDNGEQMTILQTTHVQEHTGIHRGVKKMSEIINRTYFWRGQYVDIANFVHQCKKCTELIEPSTQAALDMEPKLSGVRKGSEIWQRVEVNLAGPLVVDCEKSKYIATITDPVSRFVSAKLVQGDSLSTHLAAFVTETFCNYGFTKCFLGTSCLQYEEELKLALKQENESIQHVIGLLNKPQHPALQDLVFPLSEGEEQCTWIHSCIDTYLNKNLPLQDVGLSAYAFKLNTISSSPTPFSRMFNRKAYCCLEDDKENNNVNTVPNDDVSAYNERRRLQSSVLQCRHCEETFTSKISFRIHQRKHTEEARRRGMLEGQAVRLVTNHERGRLRRPLMKHRLRVGRRLGSSESEDNPTIQGDEERCQPFVQADITDGRRAELRASAVQAVRKFLATTKECRKRRGKYKKFPSEIQEEMARYAVEHGSLVTVKHYSEKLGVIISESTVRNIVKWYQCFTPQVKEDIGRFAAAFGIESAASHFSERLGREVRYGLIRKFKKMYLLRYPDSKGQCNKGKTEKGKTTFFNSSLRQQKTLYTPEVKEEIGQYAYEHTIPLAIKHFSQEFNMNLKEHVVRRYRKIYLDKHKINNEQVKVDQVQAQSVPLHVNQEDTSFQHCVEENNVPNMQETGIPSSSQTIDILQTSLNLLNNPQLNSSAAIIYNNPYQPSAIPVNQQQNQSLTFQTVNHCCSVPTTLSLSYPTQQLPISASVIINQNIAAVQTFPNAQMYSAFTHHTHPVQSTLTVPCNTVPVAQDPPQQQTVLTPHSGPLPAVAIAVAESNQQFQQPTNSSIVVPQQPVIVHPPAGATLLQHIIDPQSQIQSAASHLTHQLNANSQPSSSQHYSNLLEHNEINTHAFPHALNSSLPAITYESSQSTLGDACRGSYQLPGSVECSDSLRMKEIGQAFDTLTELTSDVSVTVVCQPDIVETVTHRPELEDTTPTHSSLSQHLPSFGDAAACSNVTSTITTASSSAGAIGPVTDTHSLSDVGSRHNEYESNGSRKQTSPCSDTTKSIVRKKSGARKCGQNKGKAKVKPHRGTYAIYSPEIRAEMGKYAAEHGSQKACKYFKDKMEYNVAESTMRGLRDKYLRKREMCSSGKDEEVTSLGYAPRGRPMRLGQYDEVVRECIQELAMSGEKISSFMAIATARHVLMQYEPHLLEENGGKIKLNVTWAKSFLKRSGVKNCS